MAKCPSPTNESSSPVDLSQSEFLGEHVIPRSVVRIAQDQQKLLNRKEAWAYEICKRQQQFYLPAAVFKNLEAFHARKLKAQKSKAPSPSERQQVDGGQADRHRDASSSISKTPRRGKAHVDTDANHDEEDVEDSNDETESQGSWAQSPEHHHHPPPVRSLETRQEEAEPEEMEEDELEREEILTQLPPDSSPPRLSPSPPPKRRAFEHPPSSSPGPENELELEIPSALDVSVASVEKTAQEAVQPMLATPPSAQVIPCTFQQPGFLSSTKKDKVGENKKQRVYKKVPELYRPPQTVPKTSFGLGMMRLGLTKPSFSSTQTSTSSCSSIVPATHRGAPRAMSIDGPSPESSHNPPELLENPELPNVNHKGVNSSNLDPPASPEFGNGSLKFVPPSPQLKPSSPPPPVTTVQAHPPPSPHPVKQSKAPFIEFTLQYPSYTGSISDFVTACRYLKTLAGRRLLRPFLFDDFIRAWHEGYVPYVRECDESDPPTKALTALQWFNEIEDPPVFTKQVVTTATLERILSFYSEESVSARSARGLPRMPRQTTPEAAATSSKGKQAAKGIQPVTATKFQPTSIAKSCAPSINRVSQGATTGTSGPADILKKPAPEASIPTTAHQPARPPSRALPLSKSMDEPRREKRPEPATTGGLPRSLSEAAATAAATTSHKRKPSGDDYNKNNGFQVPAPKKKALSPPTPITVPTATTTAKALSIGPSRPTSSSGGSFHSDNSRATTTTTTTGVVSSSSGLLGTVKRRFADDPEKRKRQLAKFARKRREQKQKMLNDSIVTSSAPVVGSKP